jgi:hypothetical protein
MCCFFYRIKKRCYNLTISEKNLPHPPENKSVAGSVLKVSLALFILVINTP